MSHRVHVSLNAYHFVCVHERACARSVMLIFAILNVFHTRQSTKNTFLPKHDNYIAVHEKPEHIAIFAPTGPHGWFSTKTHVLFLLIDRSVCIIQNNQILDVLIRYIANYHIYVVAN